MDPLNEERDVDHWLETALRQYGKTDPRAGLEGRLLANLQAEQNRIAARSRWWWAFGTATALTAIVAAVWIAGSVRERIPESTSATSPTLNQEFRSSMPPAATQPIGHPNRIYAAREATKRGPANRPARDLPGTGTPKLAQFPSQQPLSEQERILASYVADYPEHAALIAQARTQELHRDQAEELSTPTSGSEEDFQQRVQ